MKNGLLCPIELLDGKIIDGRRRWLACKKAKAEPEFYEVSVPDPLSYVWSLNAERRQMTPSQISIAAAKSKKIREKHEDDAKRRMLEGKGTDGSGGRGKKKTLAQRGARVLQAGKSTEGIAREYGTSARTIERGQKVVDKGVPELVEAVEKGKVSVTRADEIATLPKQQQPEQLHRELQQKPRCLYPLCQHE